MSESYWVHPTAIVEQPAVIGAGTKIWHFSHVMPGARIGARCSLGQNSFVGSRAVIGNGCKIQNNVSLYDAVVLEDDVFVGPSAVFTNVVVPRAFIERKHAYAETRIGRGASIGANATVVCGHQVGQYAMIGAGAVVTRDVPPYALVVGVPGRRVGWVCLCGERLQQQRPDHWVCAQCGSDYESTEGVAGPVLHRCSPTYEGP